jgi:hypothetical protein
VPLAKVNAARAIDPWPVAAPQAGRPLGRAANSADGQEAVQFHSRIHVRVFVMFVSKRGII